MSGLSRSATPAVDASSSVPPLRSQDAAALPRAADATPLELLQRAARDPARPLDAAVRSPVESHLGHDFAGVCIHDGSASAAAARRLGASAYTLGADVHLGAEARSAAGRERFELLAHEAVHTVQQGGETVAPHANLAVSWPDDATEAQALLHGLADLLLKKGIVTEGELAAAAGRVSNELTERGELAGPGVIVRVDAKRADEPAPVRVDCAARLHVCKAVCCRLDFALSIPEIESGRIKWDLGRPYFVRHDSNGCCAHNEPESGGCRIYADRPAVCRGYSCANDARIWKDFDAMELNTEWIAHNLAPSVPRVVRAQMHVRTARPAAGAHDEVSS